MYTRSAAAAPDKSVHREGPGNRRADRSLLPETEERDEGCSPRIGVVGLGYVGLPLAVAFAESGASVVGLDTHPGRSALARSRAGDLGLAQHLEIVDDPSALSGCDVFIIAVPTPAPDGHPDLRFVDAACATVGAVLRSGDLVVLESTFSPGTTKDRCRTILEAASGLPAGEGFLLAYSPERMNPGDSEHTLETVVKVVAGFDTPSLEAAVHLYERITRVHTAPSMEVAELAKLLENTQRDVNIALMNEVAALAEALGLDVADVLAAARTKWNYIDFRPGVVGGHCIAEDPYYLLAAAADNDVVMPTVHAARDTNRARVERIAELVAERIAPSTGPVLVYGATYKPNVADTRNSAAQQLTRALAAQDIDVVIIDPLVDDPTAYRATMRAISSTRVEVAVVAVVHDAHAGSVARDIRSAVRQGGLVLDLTGALSARELEEVSLRRL